MGNSSDTADAPQLLPAQGSADLERNKSVVRRYVEAFNAGDMDAMYELFAPDAVIEGVLGKGRLDFAFDIWRQLRESLRVQLHLDELCAEGNVVTARYTETGVFTEPCFVYPGVEPTHKAYTLVAIEWFRLNDEGQITWRISARDTASQAKQIGAVV